MRCARERRRLCRVSRYKGRRLEVLERKSVARWREGLTVDGFADDDESLRLDARLDEDRLLERRRHPDLVDLRSEREKRRTKTTIRSASSPSFERECDTETETFEKHMHSCRE